MTSALFSSCLLLAWLDPPDSGSNSPVRSPADIVAAIETVMADAIARAEPSVVAIHREKAENSQETQAVRGRKRPDNLHDPRRQLLLFNEGRMPQIPDPSSMISFDFGSGVVIGDRGEILTAFHVVRGARHLIVRAADRQQFDAEIIAADPRSDLAVIAPIQHDAAEPPRLKPLAIGDAGRLRKGSFLIALGNSFNAAHDGTPSASWGILSNIARKIEPELDDANRPRRVLQLMNYPTLLQIDAKLNLGMSGGAVINVKGELVGVTTMAASPAGFDSMAGYAIPMDKLGHRAVRTLREGKEVEYGLLGIHADHNFTNRVFELAVNSPAALGQLQINDEIIAVNGAPVVDFESLILAVNVYSAGDTVRLKIRRGEEILERTIVLAKLPVDGEVIATNRPKAWRGVRVDYTNPQNYRTAGPNSLDAAIAGVEVTEVEEGSPAAMAGLKKGQLIRRVADTKIRTPREFAEAVASHDGPVRLETDLGPVTVK
jgi:S1-C subfamily serine protease